ncbi:filamin A-interacting protein 1-like [Betta splendens]|uniref:Filamin A-interacting protein 1-like n=1 Tax=Betta splendens TaxID=158456 RepID=A0A6P7LFX2_BETSP|nr:filamin A-interacting protein 1-like [Betta splendens]
MRIKRGRWEDRHAGEELSRDDLLFLLSVLEGELQARDEVIGVLKSELMHSAPLRAHYAASGQEKVLRALQRDSQRSQQEALQDVYKSPITELKHLVETHRRSSERMLARLLELSQSDSGALCRLDERERSHRASVQRSERLRALLEQDRERLKLLIVKEREYQEIQRRKNEREVSSLTEELIKLKAFAVLVVKEQQCLRELLEGQRRHFENLTAVADHIEEVSVFNQKQSAMTAPSLLSEVEVLRRRVVEMEGKDEELIRMGDQCQDLDRRLAKETSHCRSLKVEVDKLSSRIGELDRTEEALGRSKQDCSILKGSLEREKEVSKMLSAELDALKVRVRELETVEGQLEKRESTMRQDLTTLRSLTVALVEERKAMADRLRQAEEKLSRKEDKRNEQSNLAMRTERRRDDRQSQAELEERIQGMAKENDGLQERLRAEEGRNRELQSKITIMKKKLQVLENRREKGEKFTCSSYSNNNSSNRCQTEDNKVKELIQELERLQKTLQEKEVLEEKLLMVEENFEALEGRLKDEQRRSRALTEELEGAKRELSRYEQAEKQEVNQEHLLLCRLQKEQVKSRLLGREVDSLKEKLQKLLGTEESICRVQTDHSSLQRKLTQQEDRNRELAREMKELSGELDRCRRGRSLTPDANRRYSDSYQTTREVQTEPEDGLLLDKDSDEENLNHRGEVVNRRSSLVNLNSLNSMNNNLSQHSGLGVDMHQTANGEVMMLTHTPGQPLHIKVTPHHILNTATLEISSPSGDAAASYTSTAVIPTSGASPKQRITIMSAVNAKSPPSSPDRTISPLNGASVTRVLSSASSRSATPDHSGSPIQIVTVRTCSPEPPDAASRPAFCSTPERQNSWQHQRSGGVDSSPSVITAEDNKIHIHLGSPYIQPLNGTTHGSPQPTGPYYLRHEQRTQVLANGCHVKGVGKITSSITITPTMSPATHSSNITLSGLCD